MLCLVLAVFWAGAALAERPVTVFAAASLRGALDDIAAHYMARRGTAIRISYAGSSALARQIQNGAPAQIFISANAAWMDVLAREGLLVDGSRRDLLSNRLVLITPAAGPVDADPSDLTSLLAALDGGRLAVALVDAVPAGIYAKQALTGLGHWNALRPSLAQAGNVRAALRLVALGEAPLGLVYASDAQAEPDVSVVAEIDPSLHDEILYPIALIEENASDAARAFYRFLLQDDAAEIFAAQGFLVIGARP